MLMYSLNHLITPNKTHIRWIIVYNSFNKNGCFNFEIKLCLYNLIKRIVCFDTSQWFYKRNVKIISINLI